MASKTSRTVADPGDMAAAASGMTFIDRRQCKRTVDLEILALGCSRTGTVSLRQALIDLGYHDVYHFSTPLQENPPDLDMWVEALKAKYFPKRIDREPYVKADWDALLGHCQAITDTPCVMFYRELLDAYPNAKVILTVRDGPDQWFNSMMKTIIPFFEDVCLPPKTAWGRLRRKLFSPFNGGVYEFCELLFETSPMYIALWHDYNNGTQTAKEWYTGYVAEIKSLVPENQLLVFNVKQGWKPLCEFLGHDVPKEPFPRRNDAVTFDRNSKALGGFAEATMDAKVRQTAFGIGGLASALIAAVAASWYGGYINF